MCIHYACIVAFVYIHTYGSGRKVGRLHLERLMRQRHLPTLGLSWSHLPTLGPGIWTGSCGNGIFQLSVCGKRLQYCKTRETAITTTAPVLQRERERERESNCNYYDRSSIADWEKLQMLRPLRYCRKENLQLLRPRQYCREREREKPHLLRPPQYCKERETVITATLPTPQLAPQESSAAMSELQGPVGCACLFGHGFSDTDLL